MTTTCAPPAVFREVGAWQQPSTVSADRPGFSAWYQGRSRAGNRYAFTMTGAQNLEDGLRERKVMKKVVLAIVGLNLMASAAVADQTSGAPIKMTEYTCGEFLQGLQLIQNLQKAPSGSQRIVMNFIYALGYFDGQYQAATPAAALTDAQIVKGHKMVAAVCSASRTALFTGATVISVNKLTGK